MVRGEPYIINVNWSYLKEPNPIQENTQEFGLIHSNY